MNVIRFNSKEDFIRALEGRRGFWQAHDARVAAKHKADEKKYLAEARAKMRAALKLNYEELKAAMDGSYYGNLSFGQMPTCPILTEPSLDTVLKSLSYTDGKTFTVDDSGVWSVAHRLLVHDPDAQTKVC